VALSAPVRFPYCSVCTVVSKSQLLDGLEDEEEDDDDEIDLADLPFDVPKEGFESKCSIRRRSLPNRTRKNT
jgi:hypothetical protein